MSGCRRGRRSSTWQLDRLLDTLPLAEVQKKGLWRRESSVRRYEKRVLVQEVYNSLSKAQQQSAQRKAAALQGALLRRIRSAK